MVGCCLAGSTLAGSGVGVPRPRRGMVARKARTSGSSWERAESGPGIGGRLVPRVISALRGLVDGPAAGVGGGGTGRGAVTAEWEDELEEESEDEAFGVTVESSSQMGLRRLRAQVSPSQALPGWSSM